VFDFQVAAGFFEGMRGGDQCTVAPPRQVEKRGGPALSIPGRAEQNVGIQEEAHRLSLECLESSALRGGEPVGFLEFPHSPLPVNLQRVHTGWAQDDGSLRGRLHQHRSLLPDPKPHQDGLRDRNLTFAADLDQVHDPIVADFRLAGIRLSTYEMDIIGCVPSMADSSPEKPNPCRREVQFGLLGVLVPAEASQSHTVFDIHCHPPYPTHGETWILRHQRALGIRTTALLPMNSVAARTGLLPSFNIAQGSAIRMTTKYPGEFVWFAIADPRKKSCAATLRKYLEAGASGIGEMKFPIECDSPKMEVVYELAQEFHVPVLLHFEHSAFNTGFERFHRVASKHSCVNFIGHAQTCWGNIDLYHRQQQVWPYPNGRVTSGGTTDRLLADYPNVYGDLSGNSGWNALLRDPDHARRFLSRHQDKLLFGSDCLHRRRGGPQCWGRQTLDALRRLAPSDGVLSKILWENARRLLRLSPAR